MRQIVLKLMFDGRNYCGWQVQKNGLAVQTVLQDAIERVFGQRYDVKGCGRTDSGVHALGFYCSFHTESGMPCDNAVKALNASLPADVAVRSAYEAPEHFHPRYDAKAKEYLYKIDTGAVRNPFHEGLMLHYPHVLDEDMLRDAAQVFLGTHDFTGFCAAGSAVEDKIRIIIDVDVARRSELVEIRIKGNGFLYNMVRIMVGTLLYISQGKIQPAELSGIIASRDRRKAGPTAPAHGLYLSEVWY